MHQEQSYNKTPKTYNEGQKLDVTCPECEGTGKIEAIAGNSPYTCLAPCPECEGESFVWECSDAALKAEFDFL